MHDSNLSRRDFLRMGGISAMIATLTACSLGENLVQRTSASQAAPTLTTPRQATPFPTPTPISTVVVTPEEVQPATPENQDDLLRHFLRRMYFGFTPEDLEHARQVGLDGLLEEQLNPRSLNTRPVERLVNRLDLLDKPFTELIENRGQVAGQFILSSLLHHIFSPCQLYEMMVDFWSNHFNISIANGFTGALKISDDREVIRAHALGNFGELLHASAHSPAMLTYLDQAFSAKEAPNENYARELLELHTVGVDGGYTHEDVTELARTLTGWSITTPREILRTLTEPGKFIFRPYNHDNGSKQVMGFQIPENSGLRGGERLLDYLASHESTARFISHKLALRFVADTPPETLVKNLAQVFLESQGDIKAMLRALVASPEFTASAKGKLKRPLEFFVSLLIVTQAEIPPNARVIRALVEPLRQMGQMPHLWPAPDGYPDYAGWWTTSSGMLNRWNFALRLTNDQIPGVSVPLRSITREAGTPADVVDLLSIQFTGAILPASARSALEAYAADGDLGKNIPNVAGLILGSPYFQVR